jgi:hypothetical protein
MSRPICPACGKHYVAPNYYKNEVRHYRSRCSTCIKGNKRIKEPEPRWKISGYKKKATCDLCGFKASYSSQITVFHIDGNLNNSALSNLRSVCLCCVEVVKRKNVNWIRGDLEVDF